MRDEVKIALNTIARRAGVSNFLPLLTPLCFLSGAQQKVKRKIPLRSLRLERSGR